MDISLFRSLILVAKYRNISKASEEIHLTQPAITKHIKALEEEYSIEIFERRSTGMILTEDGSRLFDYAQKIVSLFDESRAFVDQNGTLLKGTLKIAVNLTLGIYILPRLIKLYSDINPELKIDMFLDNTANICKAVKRNDVNFGFIGVNLQDPLIVLHDFYQDKISVFADPNLVINKRTLSWKELQNLPFIGWERGSGIRDTLERWLKQKNIRLETRIELNNTEAIKECVRCGIGFSILPSCTIHKEVQDGIFRTISVPYFDLTQHYYICHYKDKKFLKAEKSFLEFLFQAIESQSEFLSCGPSS